MRSGSRLPKNEFRFYSDLWESFPIINSSHGLAEDQTILPNLEEELVPRVMRQINRTNPALWTRYTQADRDADMRSIHVRSTGHNRAKGGFEIVNFHRLLTQSNPELWDHTLFVTALDPRTGRLVDASTLAGLSRQTGNQTCTVGTSASLHEAFTALPSPAAHVTCYQEAPTRPRMWRLSSLNCTFGVASAAEHF